MNPIKAGAVRLLTKHLANSAHPVPQSGCRASLSGQRPTGRACGKKYDARMDGQKGVARSLRPLQNTQVKQSDDKPGTEHRSRATAEAERRHVQDLENEKRSRECQQQCPQRGRGVLPFDQSHRKMAENRWDGAQMHEQCRDPERSDPQVAAARTASPPREPERACRSSRNVLVPCHPRRRRGLFLSAAVGFLRRSPEPRSRILKSPKVASY